jgi:hypothetical protein
VEKHPELKREPEYGEMAAFYYRDPLPRRDRVWLTVTYLGLVAALSGMLFYAWTFVKHLL